jgi:antitoxin MazE
MKAGLIRIGNSRGIRIPKLLIEQAELGETVELRVEGASLIITPDRKPREGWEAAFLAAGDSAKDELLLEMAGANRFDTEEWKW